MSEQIPSHEVKIIVCRALRQDCVKKDYQKMSAALKVPKNTGTSIILNGKKFGTTKTPGQTEQSGEKGLGQGGNQEPDGHSDRAPEFQCGDGRNFQKANHLCSTLPIRPLW